jgi:DNA modification methylase
MQHQIEYWPLAKVTPYDNNPRNNTAAVEPVANSIKAFGFQSPIIVDKDGVIIAGHTRYKAARKLKLAEVPVVVAAELTPDQVKAYRIADNSTGEVAQWELDLLQQELAGLPDFNPADFGLDVELDTADEDVEDDNYEPDPELVDRVCSPGDVWQLGEHRLMCGDSTNSADVETLMNGVQADMLLTDPPYNVNYEGSNGKTIKNDNMLETEFRQFLLKAYTCAFEACRTGAAAYIFHADTEGEAFRAMFREAGWELHGCLVWVKNSLVLGHADYQWQHEPCLYGWKPGAGHYFVNDRTLTTVIDDAQPEDLKHMKKDELLAWAETAQTYLHQAQSDVLRYDKPQANREHPTMKPVTLCGRLVKNSSKAGQLVLDLFGGSGSTMIACEQLARACYTMEYDPKYCDVIIDRWQQFTGEKAVKVN